LGGAALRNSASPNPLTDRRPDEVHLKIDGAFVHLRLVFDAKTS
jgi:hypothetical protein